ncbi:MAG: hypothetical protein R3F61_36650 [Myxococcota bacterium]
MIALALVAVAATSECERVAVCGLPEGWDAANGSCPSTIPDRFLQPRWAPVDPVVNGPFSRDGRRMLFREHLQYDDALTQLAREGPETASCCYSRCTDELPGPNALWGCPIDTIPEYECRTLSGALGPEACGATEADTRPERRGIQEPSKPSPFPPESLPPLAFNATASAMYTSDWGTDPQTGCCYSACRAIEVVAGPRYRAPSHQRDADGGTGPSLRDFDARTESRARVCIPPFPSSAPDAELPQCATNVHAHDQLMGLVGVERFQCCYEGRVQKAGPSEWRH